MLHESLSSTQLQDEELVNVWVQLAGARQWEGPGRLGQAHAAFAFEHDIIFPPRVSQAAASHMPRAEFIEVAGQAHGGVMVRDRVLATPLITSPIRST